jgi:hypothetical protein
MKFCGRDDFHSFVERACANIYAARLDRTCCRRFASACCWSPTPKASIRNEASPGAPPSRSRGDSLGLDLHEVSPDHSTISRTRHLIDLDAPSGLHPVLAWLAEATPLMATTLGLDGATLEATAAMRTIGRCEAGVKGQEFRWGKARASARPREPGAHRRPAQ